MKPRKKVRKDGSTYWLARWWDASAGKDRAKAFRTKREAEAYQASMAVAITQGTYVAPERGKVTLATWWDTYRTTGTWDNLRFSTQARYTSLMTHHVLPVIGARPLGSLRRQDVHTWQGERRAAGISPASINAAHRVLKTVLQTAVNNDHLAANPAKGVTPLRVVRKEMRHLTAAEVDALVAATREEYRLMVRFLAWSGLRFGEASALRWDNVDLAGARVRVVESYGTVGATLILEEPKTAGSRRVVSLPAFLVQDLRRHMLAQEPNALGLVFPTSHGEPIRHYNWHKRVWLPALERAGLKDPQPRIHDLRHTAVALAIKAGAHPKEIQARAGHSSITTSLDLYGHLMEGADTALAERLDALHAASG